MEDIKREILEKIEKDREVRADARENRADALADRMDKIADRLSDKLEVMSATLIKVDVRLNNHLTHHETLEKYLIYPVAVAGVLGILTLIWNVVKTHL